MLMTTIEYLPNKEIKEHYGMVSGMSLQITKSSQKIMTSIKTFLGGDLDDDTELLAEKREDALEEMEKDAQAFGANAILNVKFSTASISSNTTEVYVYGTAVKVV